MGTRPKSCCLRTARQPGDSEDIPRPQPPGHRSRPFHAESIGLLRQTPDRELLTIWQERPGMAVRQRNVRGALWDFVYSRFPRLFPLRAECHSLSLPIGDETVDVRKALVFLPRQLRKWVVWNCL